MPSSRLFLLFVTVAPLVMSQAAVAVAAAVRPNIVWIIVEDASPHIGPYGETAIATPHLDRLAAGGVKFSRAFVTAPVCSPSRSAIVSGMFQTTLGAHQHRSQRSQREAQGRGSSAFVDSYKLPQTVRLVPELFRDAGYYVVNGGTAKTDYNFIPREGLYDGRDWQGRAAGQPFFAQIHLRGGKFRKARVDRPVDPAQVTLLPWYPDDPVLRQDWAEYLNSWAFVDREVGELLDRLDREGIADETVVVFLTDHGISHARGKQFLYDEGIQVPLIVRFPDGRLAGDVRDDLVKQIDVAASSLALAGIPIPPYVQGGDLFAASYRPQRRVFAARDRCDETVDIIRCVRTKKFKYIRNFLPYVSHMQPNQYKDGKEIVQRLRELHAAGKLTDFQDRIFAPTRPPEELYDLEADPLEQNNVVTADMDTQRAYRDTANELRLALYQWMISSGDLGLIPEPILEELGRRNGSKYGVRQPSDDARLMWRIIDTIEAGERGDMGAVAAALADSHPAVRWWGATHLGLRGQAGDATSLRPLLEDEFVGVRVAAAESLCRLGDVEQGLAALQAALGDENLIAGMYAARSLELLGPVARPALPSLETAAEGPLDGTQRIARRLLKTLTP